MIYAGRGGGIRTPDPLLPKQMRYQTALRPDKAIVSRMDSFPPLSKCAEQTVGISVVSDEEATPIPKPRALKVVQKSLRATEPSAARTPNPTRYGDEAPLYEVEAGGNCAGSPSRRCRIRPQKPGWSLPELRFPDLSPFEPALYRERRESTQPRG